MHDPAATPDSRPALFVTAAYALESPGGGVQRCTSEYLSLLRAAGFHLRLCTYAVDRRPSTRLRRLLRRRPYRDIVPPHIIPQITAAVRESGATWVFLNQTEAGPLASCLAAAAPTGTKFALLSHGPDSADYLHNTRLAAGRAGRRVGARREATWLGRQLFAELEFHRICDVVFCLSETDRQLEQWLGARSVHVLPRIVEATPLDWQPVAGRIGTVNTLNHGPNIEGIELVCQALAERGPSPVRFRIVGRPPEIGRDLAARFAFVDYLGALSDEELAEEARTWCAFANPIFCYPRGSSTKLAVPLSWRIPVITTRAGARGYVWDSALVPLMDTPAAFAAEALRLSDPQAAARAREGVALLADRSPTLACVAEQVRCALT